MNRAIQPWKTVLCVTLALLAGVSTWAQQASVPSRVVETVDNTNTVTLKGNVHPLARAAYDQGAVPDSQPMTRMLLVLQRSSAQEQTLHQLMEAQQTKNSGNYHAWLTPEQFGAQFGPSDSDVQAVTDWLTRQGFQVANIAKGKVTVEFSGNAGQVRNAFHTDIHKYSIKGKEYFANTTDPSIPAALSPVVAGIAALHNFPKHANYVNNGVYRRYQGSKEITPLFTYGNPAFYALGPGDFKTIYSVPPTATGAGQSIAVLAQTNINAADVTAYRAMFSLPTYSSSCSPGPCFNVVINGTDPGIADTGDEGESDLDVEWSGALAPLANIYLVVTQTQDTLINPSQISLGVDLSALYAVDNNIAPVITDSYGLCEPYMLAAGNQFYNAIWEQAAAQGITVSVAAGDSGPAGCDPNDSVDPYAASQGVAVNGIASTPYNVAMGGTDFDPSTAGSSTYWNTTSDTVNSALKYIPEITWDDSACALNYPGTPCTTVDQEYGYDIKAAGGGLSNCISATENSSNGNITCNKSNGLYGYAKPAFQTNLTPADSARDLPDVSLFASNGGPLATGTGVAIVVCQSDSNPSGATCNLQTPYQDFSLVGGTSAAAPAFAAIMALVNQSTGQRQGNANYVLYNLANSDANYTSGSCASSLGQTPAAGCVFYDVTKGNNSVACDSGTANCSNTASSGYGVVVCNSTNNSDTLPNQVCPAVDNANPAFQSTAKYDLATGLGSINVTNLLTKWTSAIRTTTTTTLSAPSGGSPSGSNFTATILVAPAPANGEPVSLLALDSSGNVLNAVGPFTLSSGSVSVKTNLLPPGTSSVEGTYGGDTTLAASTSLPVSVGPVAGAGQNSTVTVNFVSFGSNGSINVGTGSQNFQYGSAAYILKIVVTGSNGACSFVQPNTKPSNPCPTGTVSLFSNGTAQNDFISNGTATNTTNLNNQGFVEDQPINLNVGAYKLTATYSGDQNFAANSNSNSLSVTLTQASTTTTVSSSLSSITSGQTVTLTAIIGTDSNGVGPTGSVAFTNNGNSLGSATCTPTAYNPNTSTPAYCTATLTAAISSLYPPPGNPGTREIPTLPLLIALLSLLLFAFGLRFIPQTRRRAYTFVGLLAIALLVGVVAGCGGGGGSSGGSTRTIGASYPGDTNYTKSSGTTTIQIQ